MSPTVFKKKNYRFFFFSREESRKHIHIVSPDGEAKFWLEPTIELAKSFGFSNKQLSEIKKLTNEHSDEIIEKWNDFFGGNN